MPKTIPLHTVESFLYTIYIQQEIAQTVYRRKNALKDTAVIEMRLTTGMRTSELCSLRVCDVTLYERNILIHGKGARGRIIQIGSDDVIKVLTKYYKTFYDQIHSCNYFFANQNSSILSDQSIRRLINKYASLAK